MDGLFLQYTSHDKWTNGTFLILADQMSLAGVYASVMSGSVVDSVMVLTGILIVCMVITHLVIGFCCLQICALQRLEFVLFSASLTGTYQI